jgi:hypothetical protein
MVVLHLIFVFVFFKLYFILPENDGYVCDQACDGCWSTGSHSCQFCKTFKLDDRCVEDCENKMVDGKYLYLKNNQTRECDYCHEECKKGCYGPTNHDCFECRNYKLTLKYGHFKCVNTCPITHYHDKANKLCLPCYRDCFGCTGPNKTIEPNGCTKCSSALVDNDAAYSVLKCTILDEFECGSGHYIDVVSLPNHPLRGKDVCRKCKSECNDCYKDGDIFIKDDPTKSECKACRNFLSKTTNRCVFNCTTHNEYIEPNTKVQEAFMIYQTIKSALFNS